MSMESWQVKLRQQAAKTERFIINSIDEELYPGEYVVRNPEKRNDNIQVINLVASHSIEEMMVGKLRFKTSMFKGVLDNGDDSVFIDNDKLGKVMETVGGIVDEMDGAASASDTANDTDTTDADTATTSADEEEPSKTSPDAENKENGVEGTIPDGDTTDNPNDTDLTQTAGGKSLSLPSHPTHPAQPKDLVAQGVSFLSGLAETLKSPEATAQLVDAIVEKDEQTGNTSIKIPVESKDAVTDLLNRNHPK